MTDIVERLRSAFLRDTVGDQFSDLPDEAADEIERLRALHKLPAGYDIGDDATVTLAVKLMYAEAEIERLRRVAPPENGNG